MRNKENGLQPTVLKLILSLHKAQWVYGAIKIIPSQRDDDNPQIHHKKIKKST